MEVLDIYFKVKQLESKDIYILLERRGICVYHNPSLFTFSETMGRIITDIMGNTNVFLRFNDGENCDLELFILWHELGHFETAGISLQPRSFDLSSYRADDESDPNVFAIFGILLGYNGADLSPLDFAKRTGLPFNVILSCFNRIRQDEKFMNYMTENKIDLPVVAKL